MLVWLGAALARSSAKVNAGPGSDASEGLLSEQCTLCWPALGHRMNGLANRNLPDPTGRRVGFLPKEHVQMCGVFLDVPHGIE